MALARRAFLLSALSTSLIATGCGFHLRGRVNLPIKTMYVNMPRNNKMAADIRRMLIAGTNVLLVDNAKDAEAILELINSNRLRNEISYNMEGDVREYELTLQLTFRLTDPNGNEFFPPTTFASSRNMYYNDDDYLSRNAEESLLYNEMQQDLISQLLNRISTIEPIPHEY